MNSNVHINCLSREVVLTVLLALPVLSANAASIVSLWDTGTRLAEGADLVGRVGWKEVPSDLLTLEEQPAKAASDPGYYGKEYAFKGDAVVETPGSVAVFQSSNSRLAIYSLDNDGRRTKVTDLAPVEGGDHPLTLRRYDILRHVTDEVALDVSYGTQGGAEAHVVFVFDRTGIVEIRPGAGLKGITLHSPIEYGVVPGFIEDDLILGVPESASVETLSVPAENVFMALLEGGNSELVLTWPEGKQQLQLRVGEGQEGRAFKRLDFESAGESVYLAALSAPGIWHREKLAPSYLEKDVQLGWKPPFPAKWKTQLSEAGVRTTFAFRDSRSTVWRGVPGSYDYPVWFEGGNAFCRLGKKVPPKGEAVIYCLEPQGTPRAVTTPVDVMKATLGRWMCESILDIPGRKLRTHHRRGDEGVDRACTCGCTDAIQEVFKVGQEVERKAYVDEALEDMIFFVRRHVERIEEYRRFAGEMTGFLRQAQGKAPELKSYLEGLEEIARRIPDECEVQKENMKSLDYAEELAVRTRRLAARKDPDNLTAYNELLKEWRAMGGAQDYVLAQCHMITRQLCQEAGYGSVDQPGAVALATSIRARCRQCLRNPDGYEIWANY